MLALDTKIDKLPKVGQASARRLKQIGLETVKNLIYYFPFRYDDFSESKKISELKANTKANIVGTIELIQNKKSPRKRMNITEALVSDASGQIKAVWFNQPFIARSLKPGDRVSLSGKVDLDFTGLALKSPEYEKYSSANPHTKGMVPVYHLTANLTQKQLRFLLTQALKSLALIEEWLPGDILKKYGFISIDQALKNIHFPKDQKEAREAKDRLGFDELFLTIFKSSLAKNYTQSLKAQKIKFNKQATRDFVAALPFELTRAQKKTAWEIIQDLEKTKPMARLLEGDVGSGKTVVAALAILNAGKNNKQSALMAPTEILAEQHYNSLRRLFKNKMDIALFTRSLKKTNTKDQKETPANIKKLIKNGRVKLVIGTHALIQREVEFHNLALAIIDEQHRFGVQQRKKLLEKSGNQKTSPHLLSMTATPIPRTLAMTIYGDIDLSIINQMPKGRKAIITKVVNENKRPEAYQFIKAEIKKGRQAFVICPLIDISDQLGFKSVKEEYEKLHKQIFPDLSIAMLHGRLKTKEKQEIMEMFLKNKINILVSTSVIEVGVDVPNATLMIIEGADRFGLSQLHQFRGRVGRGQEQSYCLLFSESDSPQTYERLDAMTKYADGFNLSKIDLKFRGPGEVYGIAQKGFPELKIASIFDQELIQKAKQASDEILSKDPELLDHEKIKEKINAVYDSEYLRT